MRMRARVVCAYEGEGIPKAIADALHPDNLRVPKGIRVITKARGKRVISEVELEGRIESLLATLDDLLACTSTAESVL